MPILETQLNARSADFTANATAMRALVADLNLEGANEVAASGGAASAISSVAIEPAKNEPSAAMVSAEPARPRCAIW